MYRRNPLEDNQFYHVYNRGANHKRLFFTARDYRAFEATLMYQAARHQVDLPVYALMPNHFHFLLHQRAGGSIPGMMAGLCTSAAMCFNKRTGDTGPVFEGPYKAKWLPGDALWDVACYIHLNPSRAKLVDAPEKWGFSDFFAYKSNLTSYAIKSVDYTVRFDQEYVAHVQQVLTNEKVEGRYRDRLRKGGYMLDEAE